jgi:hypothetical protein
MFWQQFARDVMHGTCHNNQWNNICHLPDARTDVKAILSWCAGLLLFFTRPCCMALSSALPMLHGWMCHLLYAVPLSMP